jgi:hypothetical protein
MGRAAALVLTRLLIPAALEARAGERRQYRWGDLEARIKGRKIAFVLPDGTQVKGKVRGVDADGLQLRVSESSNPAVQAVGEGRVPRQSLSVLTVSDTGKKWRIICTIATPFVVVGLIGLAAGGLPEPGAAGETAVSAAMLGSLAGGYLLGWALDRKTTDIEIIRE